MTKRSLAILCCLLWGLASHVLSLSADTANPASPEDTAPLLVRVMDGEGRPVAGATVLALSEPPGETEAGPEIRGKTSPKGVARISGLAADRFSLVLIEHRGFVPELRTFSPPAPRELRIALRPGTMVVGQVTDEQGRPVAGAEVDLVDRQFDGSWSPFPPQLGGLLRHRARTGPAGRFRFRDLPDRRFAMTIRHPDFTVLEADRPVVAGASGRLGTFVLQRGLTFRGTVTDTAGQPVAGARVWALSGLDEAGVDGLAIPPPSTTTGVDGSFAVPRRQPGEELNLWVCADGFLQEWSTVPFPEEPAQVRLQPAASVRGRVLGPDGSPVANARIDVGEAGSTGGCGMRIATPCAGDEVVTTDAEGRFHLGHLVPGWHVLTVNAPGLLPSTSPPLRAAPGEPVDGVEIKLKRGAAVAGRVIDPQANPVPKATLWVSSEEGGVEAATDADGRFRVEGVAPGRNRLTAMAEEYESAEQDLDVTADEVWADLTLIPEKKLDPIEVRGRVLGPDGLPVEGALVTLESRRVHSSWDGSFALRMTCDCEQETPLVIQAEKRGLSPGSTEIRLEGRRADGVEVRLTTGTLVHGRILGLDEKDLRLAAVVTRGMNLAPETGSATVDAGGSFRLGPLPSGSWEIAAVSGHRMAKGRLVLDPGQTEASLELIFPPVREVSGRVLDPEGRPAAGAAVHVSGRTEGGNGAARTRADGSFSILVPEGELTIRVLHGSLEHEQLLRVADSSVTGLEIRLDRGILLRGRLLGVQPWERPSLWLEGPTSRWAEIDLDGGWSVAGLSPGSWTLQAERVHGEGVQILRQGIEIPPGASELSLDLDFSTVPVLSKEELRELLEAEP